jgi:hypothetical protein
MKANILWPIAVIAALAVGYLWQGQADVAPKTRTVVAAAPGVSAEDVAALQARVDAIEAEIDALKDETPVVARAEVAPIGAGRLRRARGEVAVDMIKPAAGDAPMPAEVVADAINDTAVRAQLRKVIAAEREDEREKRSDRRQERSEERARQMVADLADSVGLDEDQQASVQKRLDDERNVIRSLFKSAREDGSWREAHKESNDVKASTDAQLKAEMSDEQYTRYQEMRDEENNWGRSSGTTDKKKTTK